MQKEKDITKSRVELMKNELASRIGARCEATEHRFLLSLRCRLDVSPLSHSGGKKKSASQNRKDCHFTILSKK